MFYVGQKVVCVRAKRNGVLNAPLKKGAIYTIREVLFDGHGVTLREVSPPEPYEFFVSDRFRPVVERKTDISIFTRMLTPNKETESA